MTIGNISWVLVWAHDLDRMADWYENVLGLRLRFRRATVVSFETGYVVLNLMGRHDNGPSGNPPARRWERNQLLPVFSVEDMATTLADLASRGAHPVHHAPVVIEGMPDPPWSVAQFEDPEGNIIELCDEPIRWNPFIGRPPTDPTIKE